MVQVPVWSFMLLSTIHCMDATQFVLSVDLLRDI